MYATPYQTCQDCGADLPGTTMYRRHAYCDDCDGSSGVRA